MAILDKNGNVEFSYIMPNLYDPQLSQIENINRRIRFMNQKMDEYNASKNKMEM